MKIKNIFSGTIIGAFYGYISISLLTLIFSSFSEGINRESIESFHASNIGAAILGLLLLLFFFFFISFVYGISGAIFGGIIGAIIGGREGSNLAGLEWFFIVGIAAGLGAYIQELDVDSYFHYGLFMGASGGITGLLTWLSCRNKNKKKVVVPELLGLYFIAFVIISYIIPFSSLVTFVAMSD